MTDKFALQGVRVLDFAWAGALPLATTLLAFFGAEVIKVESRTAIDIVRVSEPYKDGIPGVNRTAALGYTGMGKLSFGLNLKAANAIEIAKKLVAKCDIVTESLRPGVMEAFGLGYKDMSAIKSDIIMVSSSLHGRGGPFTEGTGFGHHGGPQAGFGELVGWPDRDGVGLGMAYTDHVAPWYAMLAMLSALDYRQRTGKGQYIDLSQTECGVCLIALSTLEYVANNKETSRQGNKSPYACPHNAYRCQGDDQWCAIAVFTNEEWQAFTRVIGKPEWTIDPKFITLSSRLANCDELDRLVEEWTIQYSPYQVMHIMQRSGVRAGVVQSAQDLLENDEHLRERGFFPVVNALELGTYRCAGPPYRLSGSPLVIRRPPHLGEHTLDVCTNILGMSDEEVVQLMQDGILEQG